jgi:hypothetical protein
MSAWQQQRVDELKQQFAMTMARRTELEAARKTNVDGVAAEQIKRLDADIEQACRDLYAAERRLKETP